MSRRPSDGSNPDLTALRASAQRGIDGRNQPHLRPVLPKPSSGHVSPGGSGHSPTSHAASAPRHSPHHGSMFYSPYGRAYEHAHAVDPSMEALSDRVVSRPDANVIPPDLYRIFADAASTSVPQHFSQQSFQPTVASWSQNQLGNKSEESFPLCNCGPSCACPGCIEHRGLSAASPSQCANPDSCQACLSCSITALTATSQTPSPHDPVMPAFDVSQMNQTIDEWMSQLPDFAMQASDTQNPMPPSGDMDPAIVQAYLASWNNNYYLPPASGDAASTPSSESPSHSCGGGCKCAVGQCACVGECCGCRDRCECEHEEALGRNSLTFAVSGERAPYCNGKHSSRRGSSSSIPEDDRPALAMNMIPGNHSEERVIRSPSTIYAYRDLEPRQSLSRASSTSSRSSQPSSHESIGSVDDLHIPRRPTFAAAAASSSSLPVMRPCCSSGVVSPTAMASITQMGTFKPRTPPEFYLS
ncbi:hypothetical protein JAAARDRAFT_413817 [Jaapia argillacea MUCL 33604]|uniref:Copper-fist domain-containing protein n=1 Tax=Jaapia argillacea MUCL 33604 TaxID=933084 RepID=A0A067PGY4_9AGAM|nr:hypothetical protein JAAARDRAFT_413817 [Jaapia argillacea MUCL 33604]